jgi:hypothetical protein
MSTPFHETRRQQFMTEAFSAQQIARRRRMVAAFVEELTAEDTDAEGASLLMASAANDTYELLSLRYTAGEPIEQLRTELTGVIDAYERLQKTLAEYNHIPQVAPMGMGRLDAYERCMQLIGLCYLLHRRDLLARVAALQDPGYVGMDALYEDLLCYELPDRVETDELLHIEPYDPLLGSMYGDNDQACIDQLNEYLKSWYRSFKYAPWHDGHLRISGTEGDYFGYWAFEAGAVALLCDIDDASVDHMVYPKDLVAWARAHKHLSEDAESSSSTSKGSC